MSHNIEINTEGIDEIVVENSEDDFISISLDEENPNAHYIFSSEKNGTLKIGFQLEIKQKKEVFRKFITERLKRASVKIKIPKHKNLIFLGNEIDIISKSYVGDISVFIEKGALKFNVLKGDLEVIMTSGNIFATSLQGEINIKSIKGKIKIDNKIKQSPFKKVDKNSTRIISIKSINTNITLTTKKQQ